MHPEPTVYILGWSEYTVYLFYSQQVYSVEDMKMDIVCKVSGEIKLTSLRNSIEDFDSPKSVQLFRI